jgi:hypothetical protein
MSLEKQLADYGRLQEELFGAIEVDDITEPLAEGRQERAPSSRTLFPPRNTWHGPYAGPAWAVAAFVAVLGLGAAAVLLVGSNLLESSGPPPGGAPSEAEPSVEPSAAADLPVGPHVMVSRVGLNVDRVMVTIPAPGWFAEPDNGSLTKDLGGDDRVTVVTVPGDHYRVPQDICNWRDTDPLDPGYRMAGGLDEFVAYLAEQTYGTPEGSLTRELSNPVAITINGHPGQSITGAVPGSDPDGCDDQRFCSLMDRDGGRCLLSHFEPNALVTLWISTPPGRNPPVWVVAASYWPTTGSELRAEMNTIVDSMTIPIDPDLAPTQN